MTDTTSVKTPEPPKSLQLKTEPIDDKPRMPVINSTNPSIVKKTLAKMTAAFNKNKPIVVQNPPDAIKNKRAMMAKAKQSSASSAEYKSGRISSNSSILSTSKSNLTPHDSQKRNLPLFLIIWNKLY